MGKTSETMAREGDGMSKIFVICPVRGGVPPEVVAWVEAQEKRGNTVHFPPRDTNQDDPTGFAICEQNRDAIRDADEVHIWYESPSEGGHFDRGMAFAFGKPVVFINDADVAKPEGKSFPNMIREWARR